MHGEHGLWQTPGSGLTIEYSFDVLETIRNWTLEGYRSLARGGIEGGGVLFGRHEGRLVRVLDVRAISCEHAHGPSFILSERDEQDMAALLAEAPRDPELEGLEPVGWYVSHTRSGLSLSERDLELHARFFPEWWQIALVTRQAEGAAISAGFVVRARNGSMAAEPAGGAFEIRPYRPGTRDGAGPVFSSARGAQADAAAEPQDGVQPAPASTDPPPQTAEPEPVPVQEHVADPPLERPAASAAPLHRERAPFGAQFGRASFDEPEPQPKRRRLWWIPVGLALFAAGGIAGAIMMGRGTAGPPPAAVAAAQAPFLGLKLYDRDGQVEVAWDRTSAPVVNASRGVLEIEERGSDGAVVKKGSLDLNTHAARRGTATYVRQAGRVDFHLTVWPERGEPVSEYASFVGPPPGRATPPAPADREREQASRERDRAARDRAVEEAAQLRRTSQAQATRIKELEQAITILRRRAATEESLRRRQR